jgi:hypothetical protein
MDESKNRSLRQSQSKSPRRSLWRPLLTVACLASVSSGLVVFSSGSESQAFGQKIGGFSKVEVGVDLPETAKAQIQALMAEKASRTTAQRKMDSHLVYAMKIARGDAMLNAVRDIETNVETNDGRTLVEIRVAVTEETLKNIKRLGGEVIRAFPFADTIEANMPLDALESLAENADVQFVRRPAKAMLHRLSPAARQARLKENMKATLARYAAAQDAGAITNIGSRNSQGDVTHRANLVRSMLGVNGSGVKIGVLSDSFNATGGAAADITRGDLPGAGNPNGFTTPVQLVGSGDSRTGADEGRAMLQIVHDLAPGAQLFFATAFNSITDFANNIRALRNAGCDIIIDDVGYFVESGLHDGQPRPTNQNMAVVIQAVNDVTASGALYFSSAGNEGNLNDGTSSAWEGDYRGGALPSPLRGQGIDALIFSGTTVSNGIVTDGGAPITLQWSDPLGGSANDYDLFRLNSRSTRVVEASTDAQTGTQDPFEQVNASTAGTRLVVVRFSGSPRFMSITANGSRLQFATAGQTRGHAAAATGIGVAATPAANIAAPPNPVGPFPNPFNSTNKVELFSSDGPRRSFFNADGSPITPGNFLAGTGGGIVRQKPDITAADGVDTTLPANSGLNPFFGTSAAAPHAGAIAALVKSANPALTAAQIRTILTSTVTDIEAPGVDRDSGAGILDALRAVQAAKP